LLIRVKIIDRKRKIVARRRKLISLLVGILTLTGVVLGYCLKLASDTVIKNQERRNALEKLIIEKRLSAYEAIIALVRHASIATADMINNSLALCPSIMLNLESYDKWLADFVITYGRNSHLIDHDLNYKLWVFQNYITNLDQVYFSKIREIVNSSNDREQLESEKLSLIGRVVYDDFRKLTSDILVEASRFYSTGIYRSEFLPSTIGNVQSSLPADFTQLALFSRQRELREIIKRNN
jgi:hypothetical protein